TLVQEVVPSAQLATLIHHDFFARVDDARELLEYRSGDDLARADGAKELLEHLSADEHVIAGTRKVQAEGIKTYGVDSIANMIMGELSHLAPEDRRERFDALLVELRQRIGS